MGAGHTWAALATPGGGLAGLQSLARALGHAGLQIIICASFGFWKLRRDLYVWGPRLRELCASPRGGASSPLGWWSFLQKVEEGLLLIAYGLPPACYYGENDHSGVEIDIIGRRKGFSLLDLWIFMSKSWLSGLKAFVGRQDGEEKMRAANLPRRWITAFQWCWK